MGVCRGGERLCADACVGRENISRVVESTSLLDVEQARLCGLCSGHRVPTLLHTHDGVLLGKEYNTHQHGKSGEVRAFHRGRGKRKKRRKGRKKRKNGKCGMWNVEWFDEDWGQFGILGGFGFSDPFGFPTRFRGNFFDSEYRVGRLSSLLQ